MSQVFSLFLEKFVVVYCDDILVFSETYEGHLRHIRQVMMLLEQEQLYRILFHS